MNGAQSLVAAGGIGLVIVNYWTGPARHQVAGVFDQGGDVSAAHGQLKIVAGELLFVAGATLLAGLGDTWATSMVVLIVALFVLWAINHYGGGS
jgi:hypothetical protein